MRERARYEFLENQLSPTSLKKSILQKRIKKIVLTIISFAFGTVGAYVFLFVFKHIPFVKAELKHLEHLYKVAKFGHQASNFVRNTRDKILRKFSNLDKPPPPGLPESIPDFTRLSRSVEEDFKKLDSFFNTVWSGTITFLTPIIYRFIEKWAQEKTPTHKNILTKFIEHWFEYKICVPAKYHELFDLFHFAYQARGNQLEVDKETAELLITGIVMESIDYRVEHFSYW